MSTVCLRGITWDHSRAFPPLVAASQRYEELHPQTRIPWQKRTLDEFGHASLADLARTFDLLIIDHPMLGEVHRDGTLLDLKPHLPSAMLADLETDALGPCLQSYNYQNRLYALPIDAAAPAASYRPDLLDRAGQRPPQHWDELIALARAGLVCMPGFPADLFLNFLGMCASRRGIVLSPDQFLDRAISLLCLEEMRELASLMPQEIFDLNPIALYEMLASGDVFAYCPFAYTYSNYSRPRFARHPVLFANPVTLRGGTPLRTILGGTGIAVSAHCRQVETAIDFCTFVSGADCQAHIYGISGGQPASRAAWSDLLLNQVSNNFFERTQASIENAFVRPRYAGYIALQRDAGQIITAWIRGELTANETLVRIEQLYRNSLADNPIEKEPAP